MNKSEKKKAEKLVLESALASLAASYHLDMAHECNEIANTAIRKWKNVVGAEGAGGAMGEGLAQKAQAAASANAYEYMAGNRKVARVAKRVYGVVLPKDADLYDLAVEKSLVTVEWVKKQRAFR